MRFTSGAILAVLLAASPCAADPPIVLPVAPVVPQPMPPAPVPPSPVLTLDGESLYVVDCAADCVLRAHPANLVAVKKLKGPVTVYSRFAGGTGTLEEKTFAGPCVFVLKAAGKGRVEFDVIPVGFKDEKDIVSAAVDVDAGQGPQPPPGPGPKPPEPQPTVASPWGNAPGLRVMIVFQDRDLAKWPVKQQSILTSGKLRDYLNAKCAVGPDGKTREYRIWDVETDTSAVPAPWQDAHKKGAGKSGWIVVGNGAKWEEGPLPADTDAAIALIKKYE